MTAWLYWDEAHQYTGLLQSLTYTRSCRFGDCFVLQPGTSFSLTENQKQASLKPTSDPKALFFGPPQTFLDMWSSKLRVNPSREIGGISKNLYAPTVTHNESNQTNTTKLRSDLKVKLLKEYQTYFQWKWYDKKIHFLPPLILTSTFKYFMLAENGLFVSAGRS